MKTVLFVCSQNRLRSPTAEQLFAHRRDLEVASAGTNTGADIPLSGELVEWADVIVVMEKQHRAKVRQRFRRWLNGKPIICLDIPDDYAFMDPALVGLLQTRLARHLPVRGEARLRTSSLDGYGRKMSAPDDLAWLMQWYLSQCDEDWEHQFGVTIDTLDNPGWSLKVDLDGTTLEGLIFSPVYEGVSEAEQPVQGLDGDVPWLVCRVDGLKFEGWGGPRDLGRLISTFRRWAEE